MKQFEIGPGLRLPVDAVTETFAILGRRGSGKTHTAVVMAEDMLQAGLPIVVIDPPQDRKALEAWLRVIGAGGFTRLCRGYRYDYEVGDCPECVAERTRAMTQEDADEYANF